MRDALISYFAGEKLSGIAWGFAGAVSLIAAAGIWKLAASYRVMIWPLAIFGLIQLGAGFALTLRTDARVERLVAELEKNPAQLQAAELKRAQGINQLFSVLKIVWIVLFVIGAGFILFGRPTLAMIGMGLALQAGVTLALDSAASLRADDYTRTLSKLSSP